MFEFQLVNMVETVTGLQRTKTRRRLLQWDESGGVGGSDTGPSVFDRLELKTVLEDRK